MLIHDCQVTDKKNQGPYRIYDVCVHAHMCLCAQECESTLFCSAQVSPRTGMWNASP